MLCKSICKKCWEDAFPAGWTLDDEKRWEEGILMCLSPASDIPIKIGIEDNPPKDCPKMFEHAVIAGKSGGD